MRGSTLAEVLGLPDDLVARRLLALLAPPAVQEANDDAA